MPLLKQGVADTHNREAKLGIPVQMPQTPSSEERLSGDQSIEPAGETHWLVKASTVARVSKWRS